MGAEHSKSRTFTPNSFTNLRLKPYQFLDTSEVNSLSEPTLIKLVVKPTQAGDEHHEPPRWLAKRIGRYHGVSSLAFLRDERYLVFGTVQYDVPTLNSFELWKELIQGPCDIEDNLCQVDVHLGEMNTLLNYSVRDIALSPCTDYLAFLTIEGHSQLQLWKCTEEFKLDCVEFLEDKTSIYHVSCCAFSPDLKWLVTTANTDYFTQGATNHLEIYPINSELCQTGKKKTVYIPIRKHQDLGLLISLDFSPDGKILAVGSTEEKVYLLSTETWKLISVEGRSDEFSLYYGLFHPVVNQYEFFLVTWNGCLQKWSTKPLYRKDLSVHSGKLELVDTMENTDIVDYSEGGSHDDDDDDEDGDDEAHELNKPEPEEATVDCPQFSINGELLAIPYSNGKVLIVDPNLLKILWTIETHFEEIIHPTGMPHVVCPSAVSFSKSCEYLAIGYARQFVAVWLLPRSYFSLKHLCRSKIISNYPPCSIPELPIPDSLKLYLLYQV